MDAHAVPVLALFEKKMRLEVPLFQRQYVWNEEQQWAPLWEDIARKFTEWLEGRKDAPVHFLGAMVLDQKQTPATHVDKRHVIDGQQRLITLQIFIAVLRDFCREQGCEELAREFDSYSFNRGMMADPEVDKFKVWPTQLDRLQFRDVLTAESRSELETRHPLKKKKYSKLYEPRPRMVEAYLYFDAQIREFFLGVNGEPPLAGERPLATRVEEAFQALKTALQVVAIDLTGGDDAQVIFETLNARGEPLLPADLLRNYIFLRAGRRGEPQEDLYEKYWRRFDDEFWRQEVRQGRLIRPRSDLFMQHFLTSRRLTDVPIKHLYVEYRFWIERERPFSSVAEELAMLARQGDNFRRIVEPKQGDPIFGLATFLEDFDVRTTYPLLLFLLEQKISEGDWGEISTSIESYLLRRAVVGWSTKAYNRVFLNLAGHLAKVGTNPAAVREFLSGLFGESSAWPDDGEFLAAWQTVPAYRLLNNARLVHLFTRLNQTFLGPKHERLQFSSPLTIEHLLPQSWLENWPLPDGSVGMDAEELWIADADDLRAQATRRRDAALQTFGNLTVVTQPLNSAASNRAWWTGKPDDSKRPEVLNSLLPINQELGLLDVWDEAAIEKRGRRLFERAKAIWPAPNPQTIPPAD